jgi:DNA invertase Pin-like site-specific DNA recombinase
VFNRNEKIRKDNIMIYLYGRCSAEENFNKGSSIETQMLRCRSYVTMKELEGSITEITEQVSGTVKFNKRPQGFELLQNLKKGDHIICSALDRFSRNTLDLLTLVEKFKKQKVKLSFLDIGGEVTGSDAVGSVFLKLLSVFSEFYAHQLSEKQKDCKSKMISQGKYTGGKKKFGYDLNDDGTYRVCEKEMSIIREMQFMRKEGIKLQDIADTLTNKHRKKFVVSWVHKLLNREDMAFANV